MPALSSRPYCRIALAALVSAASALSGCATTEVTRSGGDAIAAIRALPATARPRIAVLPVVDRTPPYGARSLALSMVIANLYRPVNEHVGVEQFLGSVRSMLTTELFNSGSFIVLERDDLTAALSEQVFADSGGRFNPKTLPPAAAFEGARYLLAAAITGFDTGSKGGALPLPIPGVINSDLAALGVLNLGFKKSHITMDLRVLDTETGRVLHSVVVEGGNTKFGADLAAIAVARGVGITQVPDVIKLFKNTPVEAALQKLSIAAVEEVAKGFAAPTFAQQADSK